MPAHTHSRFGLTQIVSIIALAGIVLWLFNTMMEPAHAQLKNSSEWPRTDFSKSLVEPDEIMSGGPPKDGIPAIDEPAFVAQRESDTWLDPREPVIVVEANGAARAYPLQILIYHEIVNDVLGGVPLSITFCPLCNATLVFDRRVGGQVLDFGTTGRLRKSDLVMYDRQTETWWQQFTGQGIIGELAGTELTQWPARIAAYEDFKRAYPDAEVLSQETGHRRPYGNNPYRGYDRIGDQPFLFRDPVDARLPAMERVLNVTVKGKHKLFPFSVLKDTPVLNDEFNALPVAVFSRDGTLSVLDAGTIAQSRVIPSATAYERRLGERVLTFELQDGTIVDLETGSQWDLFGNAVAGTLQGERLQPASSGVHFAFAWLAFRPDSEIFGK